MNDRADRMLREVVAHGGPAQADHARRLWERLSGGPRTAALEDEIARLHEAYLHDPYLTR